MNDNLAIELDDVSRTFHDERTVTAVHGVSLRIRHGELFVFVGLSGSGKSTLMRIMAGLDHPSSGHVHLGADIAPGDIGFVFQDFALLPWLTVRENVELGLVARGVPAHERHLRATIELEAFGLAKLAHAMPRSLSGGQRQRVGLARAVVTKPKILFMDEPFSELDSLTAEQLRDDLLRLWSQRGFTVVMVTHILQEAVQLADRIAVLRANPGRVAMVLPNGLPRPRDIRSPEAFAMEDKLRELLAS